jgi:uncharacterized protein HemX
MVLYVDGKGGEMKIVGAIIIAMLTAAAGFVYGRHVQAKQDAIVAQATFEQRWHEACQKVIEQHALSEALEDLKVKREMESERAPTKVAR